MVWWWTSMIQRRLLSTESKRHKSIVIVGAGPVGLTLAILLRRFGVSNLVVLEKNDQVHNHPRAHFINTRSMEIMQEYMPQLHDRIKNIAAAPHQWKYFEYCSSLNSRTIARVDQFGTTRKRQNEIPNLGLVSPTSPLHISQNILERELEQYAEDLGIVVQRSSKVTHICSDTGVVKYLNSSNSSREESVNASFVIGADGASSKVRESTNIQMDGTCDMQRLVNIHFTSQETSHLVKNRPAMLYFVFNPSVVGVLISHSVSKGEWVLQIPYFPPYESSMDFTEDKCKSLVSGAIGDPDVPFDIHSIGHWTMNAHIANSYVSGRVALVGDAAHEFPPAGGFGMNTGLQDAHSLAWRLAKILANPREGYLLDEYSNERRSIAITNCRLSLENYDRTLSVSAALGMPYPLAKQAVELSEGSLLSWIPFSVRQKAIKQALQIGKSPLIAVERDQFTVGAALRHRVQDIVERDRAAIGLLFFRYDIGFSYEHEDSISNLATSHVIDSDFAKKYNSIRCGARIPHFWIQDLRKERGPFSTVHLISRILQPMGSKVGEIVHIVHPDAYEDWLQMHKGDGIAVVIYDSVPEDVSMPSTHCFHTVKGEFWDTEYRTLQLRNDGHVVAAA